MTAAEFYIDEFLSKAKTAMGELALQAVKRLSRAGTDGIERESQYLIYNTIKTLEETHSLLTSDEKLELINIINSRTDINSYGLHPGYVPNGGCSLQVSGQSFGIMTINHRLSDLEERVSWLEKHGGTGSGGPIPIIYGGTPDPMNFHPTARFLT